MSSQGIVVMTPQNLLRDSGISRHIDRVSSAKSPLGVYLPPLVLPLGPGRLVPIPNSQIGHLPRSLGVPFLQLENQFVKAGGRFLVIYRFGRSRY